jgi:hypothetical protein
MANKRGFENHKERVRSASTQKSCESSSCQNRQKGNRKHDSQEGDDENQEFKNLQSSEDRCYQNHDAKKNQLKPGNPYQIAQRPGEDEEGDEDEEETDDDDIDEDEDNDDDEDEEWDEKLSTEKTSQYVLTYGLEKLVSDKTYQKHLETRGSGKTYLPARLIKQGLPNSKGAEKGEKSPQDYRKSSPLKKK